MTLVLSAVNLHIQIDSYLDRPAGEPIDWQEAGDRWMRHMEISATGLRDHQHRRAVALLCQHISNRYFPQTQTDMRTMQIQRGLFSDAWVVVTRSSSTTFPAPRSRARSRS